MFKIGDVVVPSVGAHKGVPHTVSYVTEYAVTIRPMIHNPKFIKYGLGALTVSHNEVTAFDK